MPAITINGNSISCRSHVLAAALKPTEDLAVACRTGWQRFVDRVFGCFGNTHEQQIRTLWQKFHSNGENNDCQEAIKKAYELCSEKDGKELTDALKTTDKGFIRSFKKGDYGSSLIKAFNILEKSGLANNKACLESVAGCKDDPEAMANAFKLIKDDNDLLDDKNCVTAVTNSKANPEAMANAFKLMKKYDLLANKDCVAAVTDSKENPEAMVRAFELMKHYVLLGDGDCKKAIANNKDDPERVVKLFRHLKDYKDKHELEIDKTHTTFENKDHAVALVNGFKTLEDEGIDTKLCMQAVADSKNPEAMARAFGKMNGIGLMENDVFMKDIAGREEKPEAMARVYELLEKNGLSDSEFHTEAIPAFKGDPEKLLAALETLEKIVFLRKESCITSVIHSENPEKQAEVFASLKEAKLISRDSAIKIDNYIEVIINGKDTPEKMLSALVKLQNTDGYASDELKNLCLDLLTECDRNVEYVAAVIVGLVGKQSQRTYFEENGFDAQQDNIRIVADALANPNDQSLKDQGIVAVSNISAAIRLPETTKNSMISSLATSKIQNNNHHENSEVLRENADSNTEFVFPKENRDHPENSGVFQENAGSNTRTVFLEENLNHQEESEIFQENVGSSTGIEFPKESTVLDNKDI